MNNLTVGSVCSGIEAASVAWKDLNFEFSWFSEISQFPSAVLHNKYPTIANIGDMVKIPEKISGEITEAPDIICGGTPCQAFSFAGWKRGLQDDRGNLTQRFVDIVNSNDAIRTLQKKSSTVVLWENVEGVLKDRTNAFGCFVSSLAGFDEEFKVKVWPNAGIIHGPKRNIAWRILDAKYFGLPQQRRRLYVVAGGKEFSPEKVLFEHGTSNGIPSFYDGDLNFHKEDVYFEAFRNYTDCLYSAYGTKWNGNAAAYNGSLFIAQDGRLRRFTPLECERLMGFPDNYTNLEKSKPTARYQALGNSWAIPIIEWLGERIQDHYYSRPLTMDDFSPFSYRIENNHKCFIIGALENAYIELLDGSHLNCRHYPLQSNEGKLSDIVDINAEENFFISPAGCMGILRRGEERKKGINPKLRKHLVKTAGLWSEEKIDTISRKQKRGRYSIGSDVYQLSPELDC
ncbi:DNA cytosine methyltransferase [Marinobacter sp. VGCF2001]|uniref:DNA cytosine methyltransferase n=1 Tax=Marinobacter sp. VGCF2001 TaxID=3417189 RepID=UPI003CF73B64